MSEFSCRELFHLLEVVVGGAETRAPAVRNLQRLGLLERSETKDAKGQGFRLVATAKGEAIAAEALAAARRLA